MGAYYTKDSGLVTRHIAGETLVVPVRAHVVDLESIYSMDEVGSLIWKLIDGRTTVEQMVEAICESYDVGREEAAKDVREFLDTLQTTGLVQVADATESDSKD